MAITRIECVNRRFCRNDYNFPSDFERPLKENPITRMRKFAQYQEPRAIKMENKAMKNTHNIPVVFLMFKLIQDHTLYQYRCFLFYFFFPLAMKIGFYSQHCIYCIIFMSYLFFYLNKSVNKLNRTISFDIVFLYILSINLQVFFQSILTYHGIFSNVIVVNKILIIKQNN